MLLPLSADGMMTAPAQATCMLQLQALAYNATTFYLILYYNITTTTTNNNFFLPPPPLDMHAPYSSASLMSRVSCVMSQPPAKPTI
jgi:hypothetical protein